MQIKIYKSIRRVTLKKEKTSNNCLIIFPLGTLVALRSLLHAAREGLSLDVMKTVFQLRALRPKLVQTFEQYALLYQVYCIFYIV